MTIDPTTATALTLKQAIGVLRFAAESRAPGHQAYAMVLAEIERLQAMERALDLRQSPPSLQAAEVLSQTACLMFDGDRERAADALIAAALTLGAKERP